MIGCYTANDFLTGHLLLVASAERQRAGSALASSNGGIPMWSKAYSDAGSQSAASVTVRKQTATGRTSVVSVGHEFLL